MTDDERPFRMRRAWFPITLAVVCVLYFVFVGWLVATNRELAGVSNNTLAVAGLALAIVTLLVEVPYFLRRAPPRAAPPPPPSVEEPPTYRDDLQEEPAPLEAPMRVPTLWDDETRRTTEERQGLRVLEYSAPPKSRHKGAVYTKDYVPVSKEWVLRVETMVAEPRDL